MKFDSISPSDNMTGRTIIDGDNNTIDGDNNKHTVLISDNDKDDVLSMLLTAAYL